MADIAASDVTVTIQAGAPHNPRIEGTKRKSVVRIQFGNGTLTYPANGVPMPSFEKFGLTRNLEELVLLDSSATAYSVKWDRANKTVRLFNAAAEEETGATPAAQSIYAEAVGY